MVKNKKEEKVEAKASFAPKIRNELKNDPLMPLRHSCEHVLHTAMQELYPNMKKVMGPPIDDGYYFDFELLRKGKAPDGKISVEVDERVSNEDFEKIEERMQEIIDANLPIEQHKSTVEEARKIFKNNSYKLDTIDEIAARGEEVTLYSIGKEGDKHYDLDLCGGPHVKSTGEIKAFKLLSVAGAYYKGDEKNKMLTRIYGTAFGSKEDLDKYLWQLEEAKKRDHRKLGQELDLFVIADEVGPGLILWTPKGNVIREELEKWAKEIETKNGYVRVATPHIAKHTLFEISGHLPYYKDDMYAPMKIDGEEYFLKGMNCPHHHMIYKSKPKSYRELPLRYAEYGMVYRYEQSGTLFGLMRVRSICQNDAHIYCPEEQAEEEFLKVLELHKYYYHTLGITDDDIYIVIGLPSPEKKDRYHGNKELWDKAEKFMRNAIVKSEIKSKDDIGGAAFYGPKIDFNIKSSIGREFGVSTCQLDLYMPTRFNLDYTDKDGSKKLCVVIHRAPLGSHERFIGFLIEHFAGAFPVWLSPVQVKVIPIGEKHVEYAGKVAQLLKEKNLRVEIDDRNDMMQAKIRDAQMQKIPYMLIVGDREVQNNEVSVRLRDGENKGARPIVEVGEKISNIYLTKSLNLW